MHRSASGGFSGRTFGRRPRFTSGQLRHGGEGTLVSATDGRSQEVGGWSQADRSTSLIIARNTSSRLANYTSPSRSDDRPPIWNSFTRTCHGDVGGTTIRNPCCTSTGRPPLTGCRQRSQGSGFRQHSPTYARRKAPTCSGGPERNRAPPTTSGRSRADHGSSSMSEPAKPSEISRVPRNS